MEKKGNIKIIRHSGEGNYSKGYEVVIDYGEGHLPHNLWMDDDVFEQLRIKFEIMNGILPIAEISKIPHYKRILKMAGVPELLIDYPELLKSMPPDKEDIEWANRKIKEFKNEKNI